MSRRGRPTDLGAALDSVVRRLDKTGRSASTSARVLMAWDRVADGLVLSHTTGAHLREGVLVVYVDGHSWATHFTAMSEQYRKALNEALGQKLVSGMRFVVSRKVADHHRLRRNEEETEEFYQEDSVESVPLSDEELAQVRASIAEIPDRELREAVLRATVKDLEWKKALSTQTRLPAAREGF
jgi:hypothetical protein